MFFLFCFCGRTLLLKNCVGHTILLIAIRQTTHTGHHTENIVVSSIDTDLGSLGTLNGCVG